MSNKRTFTIVLAALMVVVLLVCVLAACDPKHKDPVPPGPEGGTYYFDAGAEEYTVSLEADSKFTLNILGETHSGWYSLSGSALLLNFDDDSEQLSAQLTNNYNTLEFTYNGQAYTFLRKTEFTVTFDTGGGTQIDPVTVLNGKTISKPDAPSKDGNFVFEGWYSDSKFEFKYDFDAPVTGDITLHANYVSSIREPIEFTVKFAGDGGFEPIQTIKGVAYGLPEPKKDGDKFVGWWVSSSNEQDKLSYQYEGQKLTENTTFFPVWQSQLVGGIEVSVNAEGIFWTGKNDVTISIVSPAGVTSETITGRENEYLFDSNNYKLSQNGEYKFTVKAAGSDDATVRYFVNGRLSRVSCFEVENGSNSLKFNHVANAQSYNVSIVTKDGVKQETLDAATVQNNTMVFDFSAYDIPADGYVFTVEAVGKGYLNSTSESFNYNRFLDKVAQPVFDEATQSFSWQAVEHANRYVVKLNGEQVLDGPSVTFDLKDKDPGTYSIEVQPFGFGYNAPEATTKNIDKQKLAAPSNLKPSTDGKSIVWDHVKDSAGYIVYKGDEKLAEPATESYLFDGSLLSDGAVDIYVVAKGANEQNNSPKSDAMNVSNRVENITYNKGVISWSFVLGISKYFVKINDGKELEVNGTSTSNLPLVAKTNVISVRPENGESNTATVEAFEISFDLGYEGASHPSQFKTTGDDLTLTPPMGSRLGYDFNYWTDENGTQFSNGTFEGKSDTVYHANWTAHVFKIVFELTDKATDAEKSDPRYQNQKVTFDSSNFTLPVPQSASKDNKYAFEGWFLGEDSNAQMITDHTGAATVAFTFEQASGEVKLYAHWAEVIKFETSGDGWRVMKNDKVSIDYLSELTIPAMREDKYVIAISDFSNCTNLKVLNIPSSVQQINFAGEGVSFAGDTALTAINVYSAEGYKGSVKYLAKDGVLFETNDTQVPLKLVFYPVGKLLTMEEYTVPSGTKTIEPGAFYLEKRTTALTPKLKTIKFPATLERIEKGAFNNVYSLQNMLFMPVQEGEIEAAGLNLAKGAIGGERSTTYSSFSKDLTTITLPKRFNMTSFDFFLDLEWLKDINVEEGGEFKSVDGVLCKKIDGKDTELELAFYPHGRYLNDHISEYTTPTGVTKIGAKAFMNCCDLKSITISAQVTEIGESAFEGCMELKTINFLGSKESSDLTIGEKAFYGRYTGPERSGGLGTYYNQNSMNMSLTTLTLPANLTKIGTMAFARMSALKTVIVNVERPSVTFADNAFVDAGNSNRAYVEDVTIGAGVPTFRIAAVFGEELTKVTVDPGNDYYANDGTDNGVLYNKSLTEIAFFPKTYSGEYILIDKITEISDSLFAGCTGLESVTLHKGVTSIGNFAFRGCTGLQTVNFGEEAYAQLTIGNRAFESCSHLSTISLPEGITTLGEGAFASCSRLESVSLPKTLTTMNEEDNGFTVFDGCNLLQTLTVAKGNENYGAKDDVLYSLRKVKTGDTGATISYVEDDLLFCPHGKTGEVVIPGTVRKVEAKAFDFAYIETITFSKLTATQNDGEEEDVVDLTIAGAAFSNLPLLTKIVLPEGMTAITNSIFSEVSNLREIVIPATVTSISPLIFKGANIGVELTVTFEEATDDTAAPGLTLEDAGSKEAGMFTGINIKSIEFPSHLEKIGNHAFDYSSVFNVGQRYLRSVTFKTPAIENGDYKYHLEIGAYAFTYSMLNSIDLPENLTKIGDHAFFNTALTQIEIPANVTEIGASAFAVDTGTLGYAALRQITFAPNSKLETIGASAFNKQNIESLTIPGSVRNIDAGAFSALKQLSTLIFEEAPKAEEDTESDEVKPYELEIGNNAFKADSLLTTVELPAHIKTIGDEAFSGCGLTSITFKNGEETLKEGNSLLESVGKSAFAYTNIQSIVFPKTAKELKLGGTLFIGCTKLETVTVSTTINDLGGVFTGNGTIKKIIIAEGHPKFVADENGLPIIYEKNQGSADMSIALVYADSFEELTLTGTKIGAGALTNITGIKRVTIAASVVEIGEKAFENCVSLETVTIAPGSALQKVGAYAFQNCSSLTTVDFSNATQLTSFEEGNGTVSTSSISNKAADCKGMFSGCTNLQKVILGSGVKTLAEAMFADSGVRTVDMSKATQLEELPTCVFANTPNLENVLFPVAKDNKIYFLGAYTFYGSGIETLDLSSCMKLQYLAATAEMALDPTAGKGIGYSSSYACNFAYATKLRSVTLPTSLKGIGPYAFRGCSSLATVSGLDSVTDFYTYCFAETGDVALTLGKVDTTFYKYAFYKAGNVKITPDPDHKMTFAEAQIFNLSKIKEWTIRTWDDYSAAKQMFDSCPELQTVKVEQATGSKQDIFTTIPASFMTKCPLLESVEFEKMTNLEAIGSSAFLMNKDSKAEDYDTAFISDIDLSGTKVSSIAASAFKGTHTAHVKLPKTLEDMAASVFQDCFELQSVDFSQCTKLETIGASSFSGCRKLQNVDLSSTQITALKSGLFSSCSILESVNLPKTINSIEAYVFQNCVELLSIDLSETGVTRFSKSGTTAVTQTDSSYTFDGCTNLTTVKVNNDFNEVGGYVFRNCENLSQFINKDGETVTTLTKIAKYAFQNCAALTTIDLTNVELIGEQAFKGSGLTSVTLPAKSFASTSALGANAFDGSALESVTIPAVFSVGSKVGNYLFANCEHLTTITFEGGEGASMRSLPLYMFSGCTGLLNVDLTNVLVTALPQEMFKGASQLAEVTLPDTVTTIGQSVFENCVALKTINLEKVTTIQTKAFANCGFTEVTFEALTTLASDAFKDNGKLTKVTLKGTAAEKFAFGSNQFTDSAKKTVYLTVLPTMSEDGVLDLSSANIALSANMFQAVVGLKKVILPADIKDIPASTFANSSVETVDLSSLTSLQTIGKSAFANTMLQSVVFPASVTTIGAQAFYNTQLTSVTIPATVTSIGQGAFANCANLSNVSFDEGSQTLTLSDGTSYPTATSAASNLGIFENDPITTLSLGNRVKKIAVRMFSNINEEEIEDAGYELDLANVTEVGAFGFYGSYVGQVKFGETLSKLGAGAFADTSKLSSVEFNNLETATVLFTATQSTATNQDTKTDVQYAGIFQRSALSTVTNLPKLVNGSTLSAEIAMSMFQDCQNLTEIQFNKNTAIGNYAFKNSGLKSINLDGIKTIGDRAFFGTQITQLTIPSNVTTIGKAAFAFSALIDLTFEEGDTQLGLAAGQNSVPTQRMKINEDGHYDISKRTTDDYGVFDSCQQLANVKLSNRLLTIACAAFFNTTTLKTIELPDGVTVMACAFGCSGLENVDLTKAACLDRQAFTGAAFKHLKVPINVTIGVDGWDYEVFAQCDELLTVEFINPEGGTYPEKDFNQMFEGCNLLREVTVCEGVVKFDKAFNGCANLTTVHLPESLSEISTRLFENCTLLTDLVIPSSVTKIKLDAFDGWGKEQRILFQVSRSIAYATTYGVHDNGKPAYTPLTVLEARCTVEYNYDPNSEEQSAPSEAGTQELMQTAMGNVAYADEH